MTGSPPRPIFLDARGLQPGFKEHVGRGIGTYVAALAAELEAQDGTGRLAFLAERGADLVPAVSASRLLRVPRFPPGEFPWATQLRQHLGLAAWVTARRPALIHFAAQTDAAAWVGARTVVTVHDVVLHQAGAMPEGGRVAAARFRIGRALERLAIRRARRLIVPSRVTAAELSAVLGIPASRITVIPEAARPGFGVDAAPDDAAIRKRLRLPSRYLLHIGGCDERKRLPELVGTFDALAARVAGLHLVLLGPPGSGPSADALGRAIEGAQARERIVRTGMVPDGDVPAVLRGATALVLATRHEGFGLPVVEAFASGVPVVATAAPAVVEVAGGAARLVPVDRVDEIAEVAYEIATNDALAGDLRVRGLERAAQFRWSLAAAETLQVYDEVAPSAS